MTGVLSVCSASVSRVSFNAYHTKIHDMLKHQLAPTKLDTLFNDLNAKLSKHIVKSWGETGTRNKNLIIQRQIAMMHLIYLMLSHKVATMRASSDIKF